MVTRILACLAGGLALAGIAMAILRRRRRGAGGLWPESGIRVPGFDLAGASFSRNQRGGDYHDITISQDRKSVVVAVGDVAGHDALAARLMRVAAGFLPTHRARPGRLGALIAGANRRLVPYMKAGRFMTLFMAVMVAESRSIHWVSAGHGPVMAYDPLEDRFTEVPGADIPLGIDGGWRYREQSHTGWARGALLIVGTDGIWEARNPAGEMYGRERFLSVVRGARAGTAAAIVEAVTMDLAAFRQGRPANDDVTLVVVKAL